MKPLVFPLAAILFTAALAGAAPAAPATPATQPAKTPARTKAEIDKIIDEAGKSQPDWWDKTQLNYPKTLDLTWKPPTEKGWNNQKNMGQYLWDIIDPNPSKWNEGVKLVHHTLTLIKGDADATTKAERSLARMYTEMLCDYPRGAYWSRKSGVDLKLAECYYKLGCPSAAIEILKTQGISPASIKLWGDVGNLNTAITQAEALAKAGYAITGYLSAGDACRKNGDIKRAQTYYEKALAAPTASERNPAKLKERVKASLDAVKLADLDLKKIPDGTYKDSSGGYVGPVEVIVTVKTGKIEKVDIGTHHEKQFYASLTEVPAAIVAKQSVSGVDMTTGATITSEAIVNATAKALSKAQKP